MHGLARQLESLRPQLQGPRVVQPQVLDVDDRHRRRDEDLLADFSQRWCVGAGKDAAADPGVQGARRIAADEVEEAPARITAQAAPDDVADRGKTCHTYVLEHADRHEDVELSPHVAIVVVDELDAIGQSLVRRAFAREHELLP